MIGDLDDLSSNDPFQHRTGLLAQLSYAYSVSHGDHKVAQDQPALAIINDALQGNPPSQDPQ